MVISNKKTEESPLQTILCFLYKKNFNLILTIDYLAQFINTLILYNAKIRKSRYQEQILKN